MSFNLNDYEMVEVRIKKFYEQYKEGRIETQLLSPVTNFKYALFIAKVFDKDRLLATGHAFEVHGEGLVNKDAHIENCETSAIGRALANMGLHGSKRPSKEEMSKSVKTQVTDPNQRFVQKAATPQPPPQQATSQTPICRTCASEMKVSKAGKGYYCPNFKDLQAGEHSRFQVSELQAYLYEQANPNFNQDDEFDSFMENA